MLSIKAAIGAQVEVTFANSFQTVCAQQRINGRNVFLHPASKDARPGDRCLVTLVESPEGSRYCLVRLDDVIHSGDGHSSLLEKTEHDIGRSRRGDCSAQDVLANLRARCQGENGDREMLETLLDVLETYTFSVPSIFDTLEDGHYCIVISRLINKLYASDVRTRIALFERAALYCSARVEGRGWSESFTAIADSLRGGTTTTA